MTGCASGPGSSAAGAKNSIPRRGNAWLRRANGVQLAAQGEPLEGRRLDLPHALPRQSEGLADLLERLRIRVAVEPEAQLQDVLLALGKLLDRPAKRIPAEADLELLLGRRLVTGDELAEGGVALRADGTVEARHRPRRLLHLADVLERQLRRLRELFGRRHPSELRVQLALRARDLALA